MKFGETFMEYLRGEEQGFLDNCSHVDYKMLKKVLKSCRTCSGLQYIKEQPQPNGKDDNQLSTLCRHESCPLCDKRFFSELMKEASDIAGCFSSRVRRLLHLHIASGMEKYFVRVRQCFTNDQQVMIQEGWMLIQYVTMNAIAMRKILKKYDKVHSSINGRRFKSKIQAEHLEILQSPWLIELGAFCMNFNQSNGGQSNQLVSPFSCDLSAEHVMTLILPDSIKLEYNLTCPICLDVVFDPYALGCGHLYCKSCLCSAASLMIFQSLKDASSESKCPVCREVRVYANAVHMVELSMLLKKRYRDYWKERLVAERAEKLKQSKIYWDIQTKYVIGY